VPPAAGILSIMYLSIVLSDFRAFHHAVPIVTSRAIRSNNIALLTLKLLSADCTVTAVIWCKVAASATSE